MSNAALEMAFEIPLRLTVQSGPLKGQQFDGLIDYLEAEAELQAACEHSEVERRQLVSGLASDKCHYNVATVCKNCRKVLDSMRQRVTHSVGRRLAVEIGQR